MLIKVIVNCGKIPWASFLLAFRFGKSKLYVGARGPLTFFRQSYSILKYNGNRRVNNGFLVLFFTYSNSSSF